MEPDNYEYQMLLQQLQGNGLMVCSKAKVLIRIHIPQVETGVMKMCMLKLMCNCCLGGEILVLDLCKTTLI